MFGFPVLSLFDQLPLREGIFWMYLVGMVGPRKSIYNGFRKGIETQMHKHTADFSVLKIMKIVF